MGTTMRPPTASCCAPRSTPNSVAADPPGLEADGLPPRGEDGGVAGGGVALLRAQAKAKGVKGDNHDQQIGVNILVRALEEPIRQIVANAGEEPSVVVTKVAQAEGNFGYNAATDKYEDMLKAGVIDPTKVARTALQNAASVATMLLTTECAIVEAPKSEVN